MMIRSWAKMSTFLVHLLTELQPVSVSLGQKKVLKAYTFWYCPLAPRATIIYKQQTCLHENCILYLSKKRFLRRRRRIFVGRVILTLHPHSMAPQKFSFGLNFYKLFSIQPCLKPSSEFCTELQSPLRKRKDHRRKRFAALYLLCALYFLRPLYARRG